MGTKKGVCVLANEKLLEKLKMFKENCSVHGAFICLGVFVYV